MSKVLKLGITNNNNKKIVEVKSIDVLANKGIVGDRYFKDFSDPLSQLTLIESENIDYYNSKYNSNIDYFDIKGVIELLSKTLNFDFESHVYEDNIFSKDRSSSIYNSNINDSLGCMGELSIKTLSDNDFSTSQAVIFEIDLSKIIKSKKSFSYKDFSQYPQAHRDLSLIVDKSINFSQIESIIYTENLVENCLMFDIYQGEEIPENKKSLSLRINYQSLHETLSSKKLDKIEKNILNKLEKKLGIYIRE